MTCKHGRYFQEIGRLLACGAQSASFSRWLDGHTLYNTYLGV
jgi:hypothetical protein